MGLLFYTDQIDFDSWQVWYNAFIMLTLFNNRLRSNALEPPNAWSRARMQCKSASAGSSEGFSSLHLSGSHPAKPSEESSCNYVQTESFSGLAHRRKCNKKGNGASQLFNPNQIEIKQLYSCRQYDAFAPHAISLTAVPSPNTPLAFNMPLYLKDGQRSFITGPF